MSQFIPLTIKSIQPQTEQAICIAFDLAPEQLDAFQYQPGQHLTIRHLTDDGELRRCYSICSDTQEDMSIAIKKIDQGQFSTWANEHLKAGDVLEVMPPQGVFFQKAAKAGGQTLSRICSRQWHYANFIDCKVGVEPSSGSNIHSGIWQPLLETDHVL